MDTEEDDVVWVGSDDEKWEDFNIEISEGFGLQWDWDKINGKEDKEDEKAIPPCICDRRDLMMRGCKCGALAVEREVMEARRKKKLEEKDKEKK